MTQAEQQRAAGKFAEDWKDKGDEKSDTHNFWIALLRQVLGVENAEYVIQFEKRVMLGHKSFIDGYIENTLVLIEQKSIDVDLRKSYKQSDGSVLTPYEQAFRYSSFLRLSEKPRWIITCNFKSFLVYDMENIGGEPQEILLENLEKEYSRLSFIADKNNIHIEREVALSKEAGRLVGLLHKALSKQYEDIDNPKTQRSLNALCVRLVFCLYAEDANLFGSKSAFHDYMNTLNTDDFRERLIRLFKILDTPEKERDPYIKPALKAFPYVNGGLFADESVVIPSFTEDIINILLEECSAKFDWSDISPTIFGAVFESTLNPETRRSGGMHYTSIENIHKVIDPLFLDELKKEFTSIKFNFEGKKNFNSKLVEFQDKLASLKFLDPACGSGNFLTESYISLRRIENELIKLMSGEDRWFGGDDFSPIKVSIGQFYGIEINDFAVSVAKAAMWIAESQMQHETENIVGRDIKFFPLKDYVQVVECNALNLNWGTLKANANIGALFDTSEASEVQIKFDYIMGNPPFVGYKFQTKEQKQDIIKVFGKDWQNVGTLDYVCAWYKKAFDFSKGKNTKCALVSTNSVSQGEEVATLWKPLFNDGIRINFAYRTFRWDSESFSKAHVHCVIIGFSSCESNSKKFIFDENGKRHEANNINGYLLDAPNVFVERRNKPICKVSDMAKGNAAMDDGTFLITSEEREEILKREPGISKFIKQHMSADDFLNNKVSYCFWLEEASSNDIKNSKEIYKRVQAVKEYRLKSNRDATKKMANFPYLFAENRQPKTDYLMMPVVSSEKRKYIPIAYLKPDIIASYANFTIPNATLYEFGILISVVHNAWMRMLCGRLEMRYRYSSTIVYNNFPWCDPTAEQKTKIEETAQAILDARENEFKKDAGASLADLYDENAMPLELRKAHNENDKAVMSAYGFDAKMSESEIVAELMKMYQKMVKCE